MSLSFVQLPFQKHILFEVLETIFGTNLFKIFRTDFHKMFIHPHKEMSMINLEFKNIACFDK